MNEKNKSISYSKYKLLKSCQLLFKFNYIDKKFKYVNNEHNLFGIAMHTIIQNALHDFYYNNIKFDINKLNGKLYHEMSNILNSALKSENSVNNINEDEYSKYYDSGKDILNDLFGNMKKFYNYFPKGYKLIENEYYLKYPLDDANINFIGKNTEISKFVHVGFEAVSTRYNQFGRIILVPRLKDIAPSIPDINITGVRTFNEEIVIKGK